MRNRRPRLTRSADFDRVYRRGRSAASRCFVVYAFSSGAEDPAEGEDGGRARLGVSVGRRVGGAVERNSVKRTLREAFWSLERRSSGRPRLRGRGPGRGERTWWAAMGSTGVRRELAELLGRLGWAAGGAVAEAGGAAGVKRVAAALLTAPIRLYQRFISPAAPAALQVRADVLGLCGRGGALVRRAARERAGGLEVAAVQPVQPRGA